MAQHPVGPRRVKIFLRSSLVSLTLLSFSPKDQVPKPKDTLDAVPPFSPKDQRRKTRDAFVVRPGGDKPVDFF
jgi:hypothetical protein